MSDPAPSPVSTWSEFQQRWDGVHNFPMAGDCVPFAFAMPPLDRVVAELRADELARITPGTRGERLELTDVAAGFRALSVERALETPFALAHFQLARFDAPGKFLHGFGRGVMEPWRRALQAAGFTFDRCNPIVFISGRGCATNYHMDFSHVLASQIYGRKRFCGLRDPERWAPREVRLNYRPGELAHPPALTAADARCHDMRPGDVLWNVLLTPHWVEAGDEVAMSVNLSHGGLRHEGRLCRFEQELEDHRRQQAAQAVP
jgi:hypothetical protein